MPLGLYLQPLTYQCVERGGRIVRPIIGDQFLHVSSIHSYKPLDSLAWK